uniref:Uncharacterized protein n=1 Tax=Triticum urartu TaxID=4572 RepID=A0A8R7TRE5_TRIUA
MLCSRLCSLSKRQILLNLQYNICFVLILIPRCSVHGFVLISEAIYLLYPKDGFYSIFCLLEKGRCHLDLTLSNLIFNLPLLFLSIFPKTVAFALENELTLFRRYASKKLEIEQLVPLLNFAQQSKLSNKSCVSRVKL